MALRPREGLLGHQLAGTTLVEHLMRNRRAMVIQTAQNGALFK